MNLGTWYRWQAAEDAYATDPDYQTLAAEWRDDLTAQDIRLYGLARDNHRPPQVAQISQQRPPAYQQRIDKAKAYLALCHACEAVTFTADDQLQAFQQLRAIGL